jgi:hypothetical protein
VSHIVLLFQFYFPFVRSSNCAASRAIVKCQQTHNIAGVTGMTLIKRRKELGTHPRFVRDVISQATGKIKFFANDVDWSMVLQ